jgi:hypothetical protein
LWHSARPVRDRHEGGPPSPSQRGSSSAQRSCVQSVRRSVRVRRDACDGMPRSSSGSQCAHPMPRRSATRALSAASREQLCCSTRKAWTRARAAIRKVELRASRRRPPSAEHECRRPRKSLAPTPAHRCPDPRHARIHLTRSSHRPARGRVAHDTERLEALRRVVSGCAERKITDGQVEDRDRDSGDDVQNRSDAHGSRPTDPSTTR